MSKETLISAIVAVEGEGKDGRRCLRSVCGQSLRELEILLMVPETCPEAVVWGKEAAKQDSRIRLLFSGATAAAAWNRGAEKARGRYLHFIRAADWLEYNLYEHMQETLGHSGADMVCSGFVREEESKREIRFRPGFYSPKQMFRRILEREPEHFPAGCGLIRKETLGALRFPEEKKCPEQYALPRMIGSSRGISCLSDAGYHYTPEEEESALRTSLEEGLESQMDKMKYFALAYPELLREGERETARFVLRLLVELEKKGREGLKEEYGLRLQKLLREMECHGASLSLKERIMAAGFIHAPELSGGLVQNAARLRSRKG